MTTTHSEARPPRRPSRPTILIALVLVAAVVGVIAIFWGVDANSGTETVPARTSTGPTVSPPPPVSTNLATPSATAPTPTETVNPTSAPETVKVSIGKKAQAETGVFVSVPTIEKVESTAQGVGEISGPALRITVRIDNDTDKALTTGTVVMNVYYGKSKTPAAAASGPGVRDFGSSIAAGSTEDGIFVFNVPARERDRVQIEISYTTQAPTVVFTGSAS